MAQGYRDTPRMRRARRGRDPVPGVGAGVGRTGSPSTAARSTPRSRPGVRRIVYLSFPARRRTHVHLRPRPLAHRAAHPGHRAALDVPARQPVPGDAADWPARRGDPRPGGRRPGGRGRHDDVAASRSWRSPATATTARTYDLTGPEAFTLARGAAARVRGPLRAGDRRGGVRLPGALRRAGVRGGRLGDVLRGGRRNGDLERVTGDVERLTDPPPSPCASSWRRTRRASPTSPADTTRHWPAAAELQTQDTRYAGRRG